MNTIANERDRKRHFLSTTHEMYFLCAREQQANNNGAFRLALRTHERAAEK